MGFRYANAPITEALIDIRVEPLPSSMLEDLKAIHDSVKDQCPEKRERFNVQGEIHVGPEVSASAQRTLIGFDFKTSDGKQIFQARLDGFTFSRLKPYGNWVELRDQARSLWSIYRAVIGGQKVIRVAVRYINQIDIPVPSLDYKDYFLTTPEISPALPQVLSGFFMQLQLPQPDFNGMLILNQTAATPPVPNTNSVILDLDVFKEAPEFASDEQVWEMLEVLRERKNKYFEGCITDKTRALFGERITY